MILPSIESPKDVQKLSDSDLMELAAEIRAAMCKLIETRSVHFASNMGVVELTLALHTVFDLSQDRLVWDVGHQVYPHKMITGRFNQLPTIRTLGGLMGYPNPAESPYDLFMTGHAGVSMSTALGLLCGDDLQAPGVHHSSIAVVGDGAFGCGTIFEALNHTSELGKNLIVILNDNKMSICPRVGGLARYLDGIRTHVLYTDMKRKVKRLVKGLPLVGQPMYQGLHSVKDLIKKGLVGGMLFEELGFHYIGPVDGHNIKQLQTALRQAKAYDQGPVLLHVMTQKGHGFEPAENDPANYHAPQKIVCDPDGHTEMVKSHKVNYTHVAASVLYQSMLFDPKVVVISAAMAKGNSLEKIREDFEGRFFDVGIGESHAVALAAGMAKSGLRPVVDIYSTFMQRGYDQIFHEVSLQNLPIVLMMDRAGLVGSDGPTHHGVFDIAYIRHLPNLVVSAPGDVEDLRLLLPWSLEQSGPVSIRYPKAQTSKVTRPLSADSMPVPIEAGVSEIIKEGQDGLVLVFGALLADAVDAVSDLEQKYSQEGREVHFMVVNARWAKPLDVRIPQWVDQQPWTITLEDGCLQGGFGSAVLEQVNDSQVDGRKVHRMGIPDRFIPHATRDEQLSMLQLDKAGITGKIIECVNRLDSTGSKKQQ